MALIPLVYGTAITPGFGFDRGAYLANINAGYESGVAEAAARTIVVPPVMQSIPWEPEPLYAHVLPNGETVINHEAAPPVEIKTMVTTGQVTPSSAQPAQPSWLLLAGLGLAAYFLLKD